MNQTATPEQFLGTWTLTTMIAHFADGSRKEPYGPKPLGYITYTADGYMHAILMNSERAKAVTQPEEFGRRTGLSRLAFVLRNLGALGRVTSASMNSAAYSGQWEIKGDEVVHHVKSAILPDWIGTDLIRTYEFGDNSLTLTAKYPNGESIALLWHKA